MGVNWRLEIVQSTRGGQLGRRVGGMELKPERPELEVEGATPDANKAVLECSSGHLEYICKSTVSITCSSPTDEVYK